MYLLKQNDLFQNLLRLEISVPKIFVIVVNNCLSRIALYWVQDHAVSRKCHWQRMIYSPINFRKYAVVPSIKIYPPFISHALKIVKCNITNKIHCMHVEPSYSRKKFPSTCFRNRHTLCLLEFPTLTPHIWAYSSQCYTM